MEQTFITLVPTGGLCNRMNAILSAIAVVHKFKERYNFSIYWHKNRECYADFDELFLPIKENYMTIGKLSKYYLIGGGKRYLYFPQTIRKFMFDASFNGSEVFDLDFTALMDKKKKVYIKSSNRFCPWGIGRSHGKYFRPIPIIEEDITAVTEQYAPNTIGVHVRRTDNDWAIKSSPTEKYVALMKKEIEQDPSCKFYVASDDGQEKKRLRDLFGERIITHEWDLSRNSVKGMQNAVAELFCLGRTRKIIGSDHSTYSTSAAHLYDIPITIVK